VRTSSPPSPWSGSAVSACGASLRHLGFGAPRVSSTALFLLCAVILILGRFFRFGSVGHLCTMFLASESQVSALGNFAGGMGFLCLGGLMCDV
jgi:hypothetical protein